MDTVDLCSESDETPPRAIQEYDFVGSISNSPKGIVEDLWEASSDDTVAWYQNQPAISTSSHPHSLSPDTDEDSSPSQSYLPNSDHLTGRMDNDPDEGILTTSETQPTKTAEKRDKAGSGSDATSKLLKMAFKVYQPKECLKYMSVECGLDLMGKELFSKVAETLAASGVKVCPGSHRSCVTWRRDLPPNMSGVRHQEESHTVVVVEQELMVQLLQTSGRVTSYLETLLAGRSSQACTLLVYAMEPYFRKLKSQQKAKWKSNKNTETDRSDAELKNPTQTDFDYYMAKLLLEKGVTCQRAESAEEVASILYNYTKAVAEAPYKKERFQQDLLVESYMRGDNKECVKVDAAGNGCLRLWSQTVCRFPLAGLEVGQAVCDKWQSPRSLVQALTCLCDQQQALTCLCDLPVRRGRGPVAGARRLGGELAHKLYTFYTTLDGDTLLS